jgi:5-methylcytosine-specific restriction endonuclease McrA
MRRVHEWLAANPEYDKAMREKNKDNAFFGGNRKPALERDQYTCQHCGSKDDLHVHHIDGNGVTTPKESRNNALENLLTLCRGCHTKVHHEERRLSLL